MPAELTTLITGASGNLGGLLARHLISSRRRLHLIAHQTELPGDISSYERCRIFRADLADPASLEAPCSGADAVVHFAGVLFKPNPGAFLPVTNTKYFENLVTAAVAQRVKKIILISFPHVEGETTPDRPAAGVLTGNPSSVHARTRLEEERLLFRLTENTATAPVVLRLGMVYGRGILMIDAARWLAERRLLGIWNRPTWIHLISTMDYLRAVEAAVFTAGARGIYHAGDETVITLQEFLDRSAAVWGCGKPWRMPEWMIFAAAAACELFAFIFRTRSPLTRDFIRIGMASYYGDTGRFRSELLKKLEYPTFNDGIGTLE